VCERPCQPEPLVDELDARGTLGHPVRVDSLVDRTRTEQRQRAGCHRPALEALLDALEEAGRVDVVDGFQCRLPDRSGFLH